MRTIQFLVVLGCLVLWVSRAGGQDDVAALARELDAPDVSARIEACQALARLGVKAEAAVPQLVRALQADSVELQRAAALALAEMGEGAAAAVPALTANLKSSDALVRSYAAHALGELGPAAREATEALIDVLADRDATVRREARDALRDIRPGKEVALPLFARMLTTSDPADAAAAVGVLAEAGAAAIPALTAALDNPDAAYWACLTLTEIGAAAAPAVPQLGAQLDSPQPEVRLQALLALAAIGPASQPLAGKIVELLGHDEAAGVRYAAAYALGALGDRSAALPALTAALDDQDEFLRIIAAWAYVDLVENDDSPALDRAVKIILDGISSADHRVRNVATRAFADPDLPREQLQPAFVRVLRGIDDPAQMSEIIAALASLGAEVIPPCIRSLETKGPLRMASLELLAKVGADAAPAVPALIATLADADAAVRQEALFALGAIGPAAAQATPPVMALLQDQAPDVRHAACYALGKFGPDARAALPALRKATQSDDEFLQLAAVWAALKIAPDDAALRQAAVPHLIQGLQDVRVHLRLECACLLGELGDAAQSATAALQAAQQDENADVRAAATRSLESLQK